MEKVLASFNITSNATSQANNTASNFLFYHNPVFGVSTEYPFGWSATDVAINQSEPYHTVADFFYPLESTSDKHHEAVAIAIDRYGNFDSLNEYLSNLISSYKELKKEFRVVESNTNSTLAGQPAFKLVFDDLNKNKVEMGALEYATMIDNIVYSISYYAEKDKYFEYLPLIHRMVNSFKITDVGLEPIQQPEQQGLEPIQKYTLLA